MKKALKEALRFLLGVAACMILTTGIKIAMDGCWLVFLPLDDKVASVTVAYPSLSPEISKITAVQLFLPGRTAPLLR